MPPTARRQLFQSTCPARGTTVRAPAQTGQGNNFNPRAPRGARHGFLPFICRLGNISIHVPREGHDPQATGGRKQPRKFQSTCPARGTTPPAAAASSRARNFNPRAPRGARHQITVVFLRCTQFQSTCPARGTTSSLQKFRPSFTYFNPRAPRGARPGDVYAAASIGGISIHVPREGHDYYPSKSFDQVSRISIHVPREGHDYVEVAE